MPIHVLSRDGQSILGYSDGGGGVQCACPCPCTIQGWSEYDGSVRRDGMVCTSQCYPGTVRVFRELWPGMVQPIFYLKNFYAVRWRHWTSLTPCGDVINCNVCIARAERHSTGSRHVAH